MGRLIESDLFGQALRVYGDNLQAVNVKFRGQQPHRSSSIAAMRNLRHRNYTRGLWGYWQTEVGVVRGSVSK